MFNASSGMLVGNMTTRTPTGGMGAAGLGANGQPVTADGLFSQVSNGHGKLVDQDENCACFVLSCQPASGQRESACAWMPRACV